MVNFRTIQLRLLPNRKADNGFYFLNGNFKTITKTKNNHEKFTY